MYFFCNTSNQLGLQLPNFRNQSFYELDFGENCDFSRKIGEYSGFCKKVLNIGISPFFCIYKRNGNSNKPCKFQLHIMHIFFENGDFYSKNELGLQQPPFPPILTAYPTSTLKWYPHFFHQNEGQRCKINYIKARDQLLFRLYAASSKISYHFIKFITRTFETFYKFTSFFISMNDRLFNLTNSQVFLKAILEWLVYLSILM